MFVWGLPCQAYRPLAVASRATLLDLLRYVLNLEIILVPVEASLLSRTFKSTFAPQPPCCYSQSSQDEMSDHLTLPKVCLVDSFGGHFLFCNCYEQKFEGAYLGQCNPEVEIVECSFV
jgi:hypothetical protein